MISSKQYFNEAKNFEADFHPDFVEEYTSGEHECGFIKPKNLVGSPLWPGGYLAYTIRKHTAKSVVVCLEWDDWYAFKVFTSAKQCLAYLRYFEEWGNKHTLSTDFTDGTYA